MEPTLPWPLLGGTVFALLVALATPVHLPVAAAAAAAGLLLATLGRAPWRRAGLAGLPALLAALTPPTTPRGWPRPGPVAVDGIVATVAFAPEPPTTVLRLHDAGRVLRLRCPGRLAIAPGDRVAAVASLTAPIAPDLEPSLRAPAAAVRVQPGPWSLPRACGQLRHALESALLRLAGDRAGGLLATLVLGRGTLPDGELAAAHQATGLSHLLAVSGAHAAALAVLLGLGGARRGQRLAHSGRRQAIGLGALFVYAAVTGWEPPVLRAVVAFGLGMVAVHTGRPPATAAALAAGALLTNLLQPGALGSPSFALSYVAVLGLAAAGPARGRSLWQRWVVAPLRASWWATLLTAPCTLFWFGQLAPWTVLLTPVLAPLVALLLLGGLGAALLALLAPALAAPFGPLLAWLANGYAAAVRAADLLPGTPVHAAGEPPLPWLGCAAAAALALLWRWPDRRGLAAAAVALIAPHFLPLGRAATPRLLLLPVGHGQACLWQDAAGRRVAIDCGSLHAPQLAARLLAAAAQRRRLDLLVVTHADQDHHNGIALLLQRLPVARALLPTGLAGTPVAEALLAHGTAVAWLAPGERRTPVPGLQVGAPRLPAGASDNDQSLWVQATVGSDQVLLTGDAEGLGTAAALAQGLAPPSAILVLPHHGRANPQAWALLRAVAPRACLASAAAADGETALGPLARRRGADLWTTGLHGALEVAGTPLGVRGSRAERPLPP